MQAAVVGLRRCGADGPNGEAPERSAAAEPAWNLVIGLRSRWRHAQRLQAVREARPGEGAVPIHGGPDAGHPLHRSER